MQEIYSQPVQEALIRKRIQDVKAQGGIAAVSGTPVAAMRFGQSHRGSRCRPVLVQATVVSTNHIGPEGQKPSILEALCRDMGVPVVIGNCVTYDVALTADACWCCRRDGGHWPWRRLHLPGVLGVGIPQATAVADCAAARDDFQKKRVVMCRSWPMAAS